MHVLSYEAFYLVTPPNFPGIVENWMPILILSRERKAHVCVKENRRREIKMSPAKNVEPPREKGSDLTCLLYRENIDYNESS